MRPRSLAIALLLPALLLPALPAAAQSPGATQTASPPSASPATPAASVGIGDPDLARAVDRTVAAGTVRTTFSVVFGGGGTVPDGTTISGEGQTSFGPDHHQRITVDMTALGLGRFELIIDGDTLYAKGLPVGPSVGPDQWIVADLTSDDPMVAQLRAVASGNNDASLLLYYLLGAPGPAALLGEEDVDGVPTRHLATTADLDRALALVPAEVREVFTANVAEIRRSGVDSQLAAEAWVDAADLIHRVVFQYTLGGSLGDGTMTVTFDFRQHGEPLDLDIPAPEDTVDVTTLAG